MRGSCSLSFRKIIGASFFLGALLFLLAALPSRSFAFDLFARHEVSVHFASPQGKPLANAPVRVFTPGNAEKPVLHGRTDGKGDFSFAADKSGFWTVEAKSGGEIARVTVRVGASRTGFLGSRFFLGGLALLLVVAIAARLILWRRGR